MQNPVHISAPLTPSPSSNEFSSLPPFKEFNVSQPNDAIKLAFILDSIGSYARRTAEELAMDCTSMKKEDTELRPPGEEISREDKISAWIASGSSTSSVNANEAC